LLSRIDLAGNTANVLGSVRDRLHRINAESFGPQEVESTRTKVRELVPIDSVLVMELEGEFDLLTNCLRIIIKA
jgi:hypothetical protein